MKESQVGDLRKSLKLQQTETSKAKSDLKASLEEIEKLKADLAIERTAWETDKAALAKRVEDAEAALKSVTEELSGLKQHISHITVAIFGKYKGQLKLCNSPGVEDIAPRCDPPWRGRVTPLAA